MDEAEQIRLSVVRTMRRTLFVTLQTEVVQGDPAVRDYRARVQVEWSPDNGPDVDPAGLSELAHVDVEGFLPEVGSLLPETLVIPVGEGNLVLAELNSAQCWEELAERSLDLGLVGEALLGEGFDLALLRSTVELVHGRALIANYMEILPEWRGAEYGLLSLELAIRELGRCADVAAMYPMRPGLADLEQRAAANRALSAYWGRMGFVDFNGIMIRPL
ncbi:MAG TPA: hypothetical protein PLT68_07920 [Actinomycetota bacterium]|nr:hypothetical protein [Actinomycetota bacterium]